MSEGLKFKTDMQFAYGVPSPMAPGVERLVANNASAFTFKGTNTYLVGTRSLAVIDPGPDDPGHLAAILRAAGKRPVTHILATHAHRDHVDSLSALKAATGAATYGFRRASLPRASEAESEESEYVNRDYAPDVHVEGGDRIEGEGWALEALHTPGHAPDHLCFALEGQGVVFSGDHVMAWNTSVVAPPEGRMADYLRSLELLLARGDEVLLPGHGGRILESRRTVKAYLLHRRWREQAILEAVRNGTNTVRKLLPLIYRDLPEDVLAAATLSLQAHIEHLAERGLITCDDAANVDCVAVPL
ncbi:MAG TPA: MBL fold metallo-hydrolase [Hyphomicrobium sp.]|jgi:glyoxylase-like metal-dependent hydrolase (beta-lactamase superfamily II)